MSRLSQIDTLVRTISSAMPPGGQQLKADLEQNLRVMLSSALQRMDLVDREEFDVQKQVLARLRARIEELETRLETLEKGQSEDN